MRNKTNEEFLDKISNSDKKEYTFLEKYSGSKNSILVKHNICGHEYHVLPSQFLKGKRCPMCSNVRRGENKQKTNQEFLEEVFNLVGDEYTFLEEYKKARFPILVKHNICGHEYKVTPSHFIGDKTRCPKCMRNIAASNNTNNHENFIKTFYEKREDANEYTFITEYKTFEGPITFRHKCGCEHTTTPSLLTRSSGGYTGTRCPDCYGYHTRDNEMFQRQLEKLVGDEYIALSEYIGVMKPVKMLHKKCGSEFGVTPNSFLNNGSRCPICNNSKGEERIRIFLEKNNILYKREFRYSDCKNIRLLKFDFMINDKLLIEYDGIQHFEEVEIFRESLTYIQKNDDIKNQYCKDNDIKLIRIPYWDYDRIEEILQKELATQIMVEA